MVGNVRWLLKDRWSSINSIIVIKVFQPWIEVSWLELHTFLAKQSAMIEGEEKKKKDKERAKVEIKNQT